MHVSGVKHALFALLHPFEGGRGADFVAVILEGCHVFLANTLLGRTSACLCLL